MVEIIVAALPFFVFAVVLLGLALIIVTHVANKDK